MIAFKIKKIKPVLSLFILLLSTQLPAQPILTIDLDNKGAAISPVHYGVFFEDINLAADGGLYAELVRNRSFEDAETPDHWILSNILGAESSISLVTDDLLNPVQGKALKMSITDLSAVNAQARLINKGYWGMNIIKGQTYKLSFYAKCDTAFEGTVAVSLENKFYQKLATNTISGLGPEWKKFTCELRPDAGDPKSSILLSPTSTGTVWFDVVSLFPPTFKDRENGLRPDLAQLIADMNPKFLRFPGGCFVEGDWLANRFQWKNSIGSIEERPGHYNLWGYRSSDGLGYHEYLQLCEDVDAIPMFVVNAGVAHNDFHPYNDLEGYIQDALDAIEYANGDVNTTYGAMRAAEGHPESFNLKYLEIGNENYFGDHYGDRYILFYNAIKAQYPDIECIGNVAAWGSDDPQWTFSHPVDLVDEHYYRNPQWFINQYNKYDQHSRTRPNIYVGEYAVTQGCGLGNLAAAIGEAVFMCGMEKNSDIVPMNSYAPLFVHINHRTWNPDLINFNSSEAYCTPSYYVQKMFANNIGTVNLLVEDSLNRKPANMSGAIGVGTWSTTADFDDIRVESSTGILLINDPMNDASAWTPAIGTWSAENGIYSQTSMETDCRSITENISDTAYTYSLKARKTVGDEGFLIIFAAKDPDNFYWWNLGGWGNTTHGVERCISGAKTIISEVPGSIQTDVWYDIRITVSSSKVDCYLDDVLIQSFELQPEYLLYTSASIDENEDLIYLKIVNPAETDIETTLAFKGMNSSELNGEITVLSSGSPLDENSLSSPEKVFPETTSIHDYPTEFSQIIRANSVNVFKIDNKNHTQIQAINIPLKDGISLSPNPADDQILIRYDDNRKLSVRIINSSGRLLISQEVESGSLIDLSTLNQGVYLLHAEGLGVKKFIKY